MEDAVLLEMGRIVGLSAGVVGILVGIDLLCGARVLLALKRFFDRTFDIDELIIRATSTFRKTLDSVFNSDEVLLKGRRRVVLGIALIVVCVTMILFDLFTH